MPAHPTQPMRYQVFLSFRGPDTRKTFTDHLYAALFRKGIVTFIDDKEIEPAEDVQKTLLEAIDQSRYCIVVLSQQFASSWWCLYELQHIVETKQKDSIFPVFYEVEPRDIGKALANLGGEYLQETKEQWSQVLSKVAKISGRLTQNTRGEATLVEEIATKIWNKLCDQLPSNFEYLVGDMQSKAERVVSNLGIGLDDTRFIGIWGMGGAGKTTLGRVVYNAVNKETFHTSCFLSDIRKDSEKFGLVHLQKKLLSNLKLGKPKNIKDSSHGAEIIRSFLCDKKVLIVFDDVSHRSQLDNLARDEKWFGAGSKIIITTRDKHLLTRYKDFYVCEVDKLCDDESLELLRQKAFKNDQPEKEDFTKLSNEVVKYADGHPMALEVWGSFLCRRKQNEWICTIDWLRKNLNREILSQLRSSYDELEEKYKTIFLDIACFFNKQAKFKVENILKICGLDEIVGVKVLTEKSLLSSFQSKLESGQTTREHQNKHDSLERLLRGNTGMAEHLYVALNEEGSKEYLYMHDLLQKMGRNIVFQECPINAGRRSRLWSLEDINLVLKENKGTKHVQSIVLESQEDFEAEWDPKCFSKMTNLRLLNLSKVRLRGLKSLPTALKFLRWDGYAEDYLPSIQNLWNLESLQLCNSNIRKLWEGSPVLNKLRIIDMSGSEFLSETPDFCGTLNLEELLLNECRNLTKVHDSVATLKKLVKLSLKDCSKLKNLPRKLKTNSLQEFILTGCTALVKLPNFGKGMTSLYFFSVSGTRIKRIPSTINKLKNLKILDLWGCNKLDSLPADLPSSLIVCTSNSHSPNMRDAIAQLNLPASRAPKRPGNLQGPIHIFGKFEEGATILKWFKRWEYCRRKDTSGDQYFRSEADILKWFPDEQREYYWGKDPSGECVTITADIPVADSNEECRGIAICLYLKSLSQASESYIFWRFKDQCHPNKTKMHGNLKPVDGWAVYVGFFPFDSRSLPSDGEATQLDFTLSFLTTNTARDLLDLAIMGCQWRLASKLEFDQWRPEYTALSPSGHGSRDREGGESIRSAAGRKGKRKIQETRERGESSGMAAERLGKRKKQENQSTGRKYALRSQKAYK